MRKIWILILLSQYLFSSNFSKEELLKQYAPDYMPFYYQQKEIFKKAENEKTHDVLIYFTSRTVPFENYLNMSYELSRLLKVDPNLKMYQVIRGIDTHFADMARQYAQKFSEYNKTKAYSIKALHDSLRLAPLLFRSLDIKRVPALALARCKGDFKESNCKIKYLSRGIIAPSNFFEKIMEYNNTYRDHFHAIIDPDWRFDE